MIDANVRTDVGWFRRLAQTPARALEKLRSYIERGDGERSDEGSLSAMLVEFKYFTNAAAEKGNILGRAEPDAETVEQALAYRKALARRLDWNHPISVAVVEVCGNTGYNWFDLTIERLKS